MDSEKDKEKNLSENQKKYNKHKKRLEFAENIKRECGSIE